MIDNIYTALNKVMQEVGYVQKKRTQGLNYAYAGEAALIEATRPHLVANEIVVYPVGVQGLHIDDYITSNQKHMNRTIVTMIYRFAHAPSDTHIDVVITGEGADVGDKSANKALTGAYKYALRQTLLIETGDDPDKDASVPGGNVQQSKQDIKPPEPTAAMKKKFHATGVKKYGDAWDDKRPELVKAISKKRENGQAVTSSNELYRAEMQHLIDGMEGNT